MKHLYHAISSSNQSSASHAISLSFWFWEAASSKLLRTLEGCLRSLLLQLLQHNVVGAIVANAIIDFAAYEWTRSRLVAALKAVLKKPGIIHTGICIFLDGLDESVADGEKLVDLIVDIGKSFHNVKFCVSSRPERLFELRFASRPKLRMQDLNSPDIDAMIQQDLFHASEYTEIYKSDHLDIQFDIRTAMQTKAQGVILWVHLVIRNLLRGFRNWDTAEQILKRVEEMPAELDMLYDTMLRRCDPDLRNYKKDAALYCRLILHREMDLIEFCLAINDQVRTKYLGVPRDWQHLHHSLQCERVKVWVNARTGGLLEVVERKSLYTRHINLRYNSITDLLDEYGSQSVVFIHRTARTYLLESSAGQHLLATRPNTSIEIEQICLETKLARGIILPALESASPLGIYFFYDNVLDIFCDTEKCTTYVKNNEQVLNALHQQGRLLTERIPTRYAYGDSRCEAFPVGKGGQLNHYLIYASRAHWDLLSDILSPQRSFDVGSITELAPQIVSNSAYATEEEIKKASLLFGEMDVNHLVMTEFGEEVSLFHETLWMFTRTEALKEHQPGFYKDLLAWLACARRSTVLRTIVPTMRACGAVFFQKPSIAPFYSIIGNHDLRSLRPIFEEYLGVNIDAYVQNELSEPLWGPFLVHRWDCEARKLYAVPKTSSYDLQQYLVRVNKSEHQNRLRLDQFGMIHLDFCEALYPEQVSQIQEFRDAFLQTPLPSLYAGLLYIGKSEESVLAFAAAEEAKLSLQLTNEEFQRWKKWFWGPLDTSLDDGDDEDDEDGDNGGDDESDDNNDKALSHYACKQ